jgi:hypothetical protein
MTKRHKIQRPREELSFTGKCHCGDIRFVYPKQRLGTWQSLVGASMAA